MNQLLHGVGFSSRPMHDIPPTGDGFFCVQSDQTTRMMLADGMGHGVNAHQVVQRLIGRLQWLCKRTEQLPSIVDCFMNLDRELRQMNQHDAQAAVAIIDIDWIRQTLSAACVGNIETFYVHNGFEQHFSSLQGMVGGHMSSQIKIQQVPIQAPALIAMITDGIQAVDARQTLCAMSASSSLKHQNAQLIADNIVRYSHLPYDDASCALTLLLPR